MLLVYVRHDKEGLLGKVARCYLKAIFLGSSGFLLCFFPNIAPFKVPTLVRNH